jgi:hypothetical protein
LILTRLIHQTKIRIGTHWVHKTFANVQQLPTLDLTKLPSQLAHSPFTNASR